jgi:hypothetical protein
MMTKKRDGFVIDLNRITKREFHDYLTGRERADNKDLYDAEKLYPKVIMTWPFPQKISVEGYQELGLLDAMKVDSVVSDALIQISQKKLEPRLS